MPVSSPGSLQQITSTMIAARETSGTAGTLTFQVQGRACLVTRHRGALCLHGLTASAGKEQGWVSRKQANRAACKTSSAMRRRRCQLEALMAQGPSIRKTGSGSAVLLGVRGSRRIQEGAGQGAPAGGAGLGRSLTPLTESTL